MSVQNPRHILQPYDVDVILGSDGSGRGAVQHLLAVPCQEGFFDPFNEWMG